MINLMRTTLAIGLLLWSAGVFAPFAAAQKPLIVNIDNPNFRKLVVAIPKFEIRGNADPELNEWAAKAPVELARLLNFSGLFNIMGEAAYQEVLANKKGAGTGRDLDGIDIVQWKALGVESLTVGELQRAGGQFTVSMRTADIYQGKLVLGKQFSNVKPGDMPQVMRRYADHLLQAYTGKPGIFSSKLLFIGRKNKNDPKHVFISDFDGSNVKQITSGAATHLSPNWSPDNRFITYTSYEDGNPDLFIYEVATGQKRKLSGRKGLNSGSNWAHSGKIVAFTGSQRGDADIYTIPVEGGQAKPLIRGVGLDVDPTFSPDGKYMLFVSGRYGNPHIFKATLSWDGDLKPRVIGQKRMTYAGWYNATPSWAPDGEKIAFAGYDRDIDRFDLFLMPPDGKQLERLTIRTGDNEAPSWAPNGQMIVFQSNRSRGRDVKGRYQLYVMNRDGSGQRQLITGLYEAQTPKWSGPLQ